MCNDCSVYLGGRKCSNNCKVIKAIKALEQESVLDKIIAEIKELDTYYVNDFYIGNMDAMLKRDYVLQILDKYQAKPEEK